MERGNSTGQQSQNLVPESWTAPASATIFPSTVQFRLKIIWRVVNTWMSIGDEGTAAAPSMAYRAFVDEVVRELPPLDYRLFVADYFSSRRLLCQILVSMGIHPILHGAVIRSIFDYIWSVRAAVSRMAPGTIFRVRTRFTSDTLQRPVSNNWAGEDYEFQEEVQPTGMIPATDISIKGLERVKVLENESCTICLEELVGGSEATAMPCWHLFHDACITAWLEKSHLCPLCRFQMPTS